MQDNTLQDYYASLLHGTPLRKVPASQRLADISVENARIVKSLLDTAKKANDKGQRAIANEIMTSIGELLTNNENLQKVVVEIKRKID